ncbi:MAG: hypothetical protein MR009_07150 [Sutterellaceae bacterium]|nr:hypothetical protein [Sutterellaceae bacterium]MDD7442315.1 hypothetical protein [Sutterellaceae bacterium]MDY2868367.1 hypothetical protein [Mesosutterella sp.]
MQESRIPFARHRKKLWLVGDSVWCPFIDEVIAAQRPDAVVINAARAGFVTPFGFEPIIMGSDDVVRMCRELPGARVIASHLDCVPHATVTRADVQRAAEKAGFASSVLIPADGETVAAC